jgi:pheromone shutdown protein TraB
MNQEKVEGTEPFEEKEKRIMHSLDMRIILYFLLLFATICAVSFFLMWFSFNAGFEKASEMCLQGTLQSVLKQVSCT